MAAFEEGFNTLLGQIATSSNYTCTNQCSSCFTALNSNSKLCGLLSLEESSSVKNRVPNFTLEEILTFSDDDYFKIVDEARFYFEDCVQYVIDFDKSELCLSIDYMVMPMEIPSEIESINCNLTYNGVRCNSCILPIVPYNANSTASTSSTDDPDCIIADCTNVDATYGTMIDVCQNIGLGGPFQYFARTDSSAFTPGTCDDIVTPPDEIPSSGNTPAQSKLLMSLLAVMFTPVVFVL